MNCPCCGSGRSSKAFDSIEPGFRVQQCSDCGLGRTVPALRAEELGKYYPETYYGRENVRFNFVIEWLVRLFRWRRARLLRRLAPPGPVLDVGCGRGFILSYLKALGCEAHGTELSDAAAWHARNVLGLEVSSGDFLSFPRGPGRYNAVIFWHTLEHLPQPFEALALARDILKTGGLLVAAVPNFESDQARLFGRHWFHLDIPRHFTHFSRRAIEALLSRLGFRIVRLDHFSFEQNPYGWLQSFLDALGFDHNFLYDVLKDRGARTRRIRRHPVQALLTLLLLPPLALLSLLLLLWETARRRGGAIEIYAVKQ
ncbi:MAG: class I SAM-dependent methyltransferase [Elusimicrobia bacterium]|nr:class I SAM-dependent methyltransferase [Elusimicrobiota bacterium]